MGLINGILGLLKLVILLIFKCVEFIFISMLFSLPFWFIYSKIYVNRFELPTIFYLDFVIACFILQMIALLWGVANSMVKTNFDDKKTIVLSTKSNDNKSDDKKEYL